MFNGGLKGYCVIAAGVLIDIVVRIFQRNVYAGKQQGAAEIYGQHLWEKQLEKQHGKGK